MNKILDNFKLKAVCSLCVAVCLVWPLLQGCSSKRDHGHDDGSQATEEEIVRDGSGSEEEDLRILAEQAVDAWMFYNLQDFRSYEPLIRNTEYLPDSNLYIHTVRYREMNENGGMMTYEKTFKVRLILSSDGRLEDYEVREIP